MQVLKLDSKKSNLFSNCFIDSESVTLAGRLFQSLTTMFVKKLVLCIHLTEGCPESLLLCLLIPLVGPVCKRQLHCTSHVQSTNF